ncbi:MAG: AAA family ATPase [Fusobacteriota bacterium]
MRPLKLSMKAFGPYPKEEIINFSELEDKNLFLITGPTGSGKTTIFDAISFAMYGEANGNTRITDQLRSQFADDDVLTEVDLEFVLKDIKYHINRIPKQMRKKKRGDGFTEQSPDATLKIFDQKPARIITGVTSVNDKIEEIIGINIDQFRQIMMIPQGDFRKLLISDSQDREEVLQKLFNTKKYNIIQEKLKKDFKELKKEISKYEASRTESLGRIKYDDKSILDELLSSEERDISKISKLIKESIKKDKKILKTYEKQLEKIKKKYEQNLKLKNITIENNKKLLKKSEIKKEIEFLNKEKDIIDQKKTQLNKGKKAKDILPFENELNSQKEELIKKDKKLKLQEKKLEDLQSNFKEISPKYERYNSDKFKLERDSLIGEKKSLEGFLEKFKKLEGLTKELEKTRKLKNKLLNQEKDLEKQKDETQLKIKKNINLKEKAKDAKLQLTEIKSEISKNNEILNISEKLINELEILNKTNKKLLDINSKKDEFEKKLKEKELEFKKAKHNFFANQAAILAKELEEGDECPVCGSTHHEKLARPTKDSIDKDKLDKVEKEYNKLNENFQDIKQKLIKSNSKKDNSEEKIKEKIKELKEKDLQKNNKNLNKNISKSDIKNIQSEITNDLEDLKKKKKELNNKSNKISEYEKNLKNYNNDLENLKKSILKNSSELDNVKTKFISLDSNLKEFKKDLPEEINDQEDLQNKISEKNRKILELDTQKKETDLKYNKLKSDIQSNKNYTKELKSDIDDLKNIIKDKSKKFKNKISESDFKDYDDYNNYKYTSLELEKLQKEIAEFNKNLFSLNNQYESILKETQDIKKEDVSKYDDIIMQINNTEKELADKKGTLRGKITNNETELRNIEKINNNISKKEKRYKILGNLADIADGKNENRMTFERYVLAAFFEDILLAANQRLEEMSSGRYFLTRTDEKERANKQSGLEMKVLDNYTGEFRHVRTLSGGESFKASLAMALGLSDVVQSYAGNVRLDTMFIDEGFGTLDSESLDSAIDCLVDLQKRGRLVGIISHVSELKERIDVRLEVNATNQGSTTNFKML